MIIVFNKRRVKIISEDLLNITLAEINIPYIVKGINTNQKDIRSFLFSLGFFEGEVITVISVIVDNYIVHVKNARYSIEKDLAEIIWVYPL